MRTIYLYGIGGADKQYKVLRYTRIDDYFGLDIIRTVTYEAGVMRAKYPSVKRVYAITDRRGLHRDYMESVKKDTIESCAIFKDILEREGLRIPV